jgi:hypothetical protein
VETQSALLERERHTVASEKALENRIKELESIAKFNRKNKGGVQRDWRSSFPRSKSQGGSRGTAGRANRQQRIDFEPTRLTQSSKTVHRTS